MKEPPCRRNTRSAQPGTNLNIEERADGSDDGIACIDRTGNIAEYLFLPIGIANGKAIVIGRTI